jgi:hypothetical protein
MALRSEGDSEKKAISDPDAKPEATNSKQASTPEKTAPVVGVRK